MSKNHINRVDRGISINGRFFRDFYSPGYSSITVSFLQQQFSLSFNRYSGEQKNGFDRYGLNNGIRATVNYENASYLYQVAMSILKDINSEKEMRAVLDCDDATLILECKPDQNNQMAVYLTIEKNNRSIPFKFMPLSDQAKENGQMVTKGIQSGLGAFVETIEMYLTGNVILENVKIC